MSNDIYQQELLDLAQFPTGADRIKNPDVEIERSHLSCGDKIKLQAKVALGKLKVSCQVDGCLICQASASLMCREVNGKSRNETQKLISDVDQVLKGSNPPDSLISLSGVAQFPNRHGCAWLPWQGLSDCISKLDKLA
ncbi:MAG: iron-sulfur cluster assembly scaffold protein [Patescibacteria group bacterium]|jgi:nitrogen fixation NifU-like protein